VKIYLEAAAGGVAEPEFRHRRRRPWVQKRADQGGMEAEGEAFLCVAR
jgi:hypothetical protein